jgi:hypothetical protein
VTCHNLHINVFLALAEVELYQSAIEQNGH